MLPSGYLQVEYIAGTGTQYININYAPQSDNVVYETAWMETTLNSAKSLFGCQGASGVTNRFSGTHYKPSTTEMYSATGATDGLCRISGITANTVNTLTTTINNGSITRVQNGTTSTASYSGTIKTSYNIYLLANNITGTASQIMSNTRLYYWRMTDNGVLVRDMVPAERISDGAIGMYDTVNDVFYGNAGSGVFTKGKYVVDESQIVKLEYLESTGTQHIDTEYSNSLGFRAVMDVIFTAQTTSSQILIGSHDDASPYRRNYLGIKANSGQWEVGAYDSFNFGSSATNTKYDIDVSTFSSNFYCKINGVAQTIGTPTNVARSARSVYLLAMNYGSLLPAFARIYKCDIWNEEGKKERNYYPAKLPANGTIGLWDAVTGMLYTNAGTGEFIAGPYLANEEDVVLLEYIESSGTQYIDTGFIPNQDTRVYAECVFPTASTTQALFGTRTSSSANQFQFVTSGDYYRSDYNTSPSNVTNASYGTERFYVDKAKNVFDLNGDYSLTQIYAAFICPGSMFVFATNNNGSVYAQASATIYVLRAYDDDTPVRDYYPARFSPTSEAGLYDAANGMFYINAGTGTFIEGPEIPTELPAPQNLRATSVTESAITIEWDAVEKATGYKVFRNYVPVSEGTVTTYIDYAPEPYNGYIYSVAAYNEDMQSVQAEVRVASVGGNPILDLITDRTSEDVDYAKRLAAKGLAAMTDEEKAAFINGLKGAYNAKDLNRVESAVAFLPSFLNGIQDEINRYLASLGVAEDELYRVPYDTPIAELETKTDWAIVDIPYEADFVRYLANIAVARNWIELPNNIPAAPDSIQRLTADAANAIEKILLAVYETALAVKADKLVYADRAKDAWKYCGTFNSGQEVIF